MDLMKIGAQMMLGKMTGGSGGEGLSLDSITSALGGLLSDSDGKSNLMGLVASMQEKGLGSIAESWLGDGDNDSISTDQMRDVVGSDKIAELATQLDTDEGSLLSGLSDALPQIVDKSSQGGSLLDDIGGLGGAMNMAKKFFS